MPSPTDITVNQLARLIGTPGAPIIVDVRLTDDVALDPNFIPGSRLHAFDQITQLAPSLEGQRVVVYCQKGKKISQGAAALLRAAGVAAETLEGGHWAWRDAGLALVSMDAVPRRDDQGRTLWVTRHRPKIDRLACPWLIRRFVDPRAQFLFVAPGEVLAVAERFCATAFDMPDGFWSHRGDGCTFDTMVDEFGLACIPGLAQLATIVRAADTNRHDLAPQAAGLLAASVGLSRMYRDDLEQLDAGMLLYDAFYRWARDGQKEGHDWPAAAGPLPENSQAAGGRS
ncbi:MAG: sulfurtransferase/chromate resistance protein [Pseudomonadota bacterium]